MKAKVASLHATRLSGIGQYEDHPISGEELAHAAEFFVALLDELFAETERESSSSERASTGSSSFAVGGVIGVRAAFRLGNDLVDQLHLQQIGRGDLQRFGGDLRPLSSRAT